MPVEIAASSLRAHEMEVSSAFTRKTTLVELSGAGHTGAGEDVTYAGAEHDRLQARGVAPEVLGSWTLASFSARLDDLDLFNGRTPAEAAARDYRRWAYESAALDLALRQAGTSLDAMLGRAREELRFVVSMRLPEASTRYLEEMLARDPTLRFKLDLETSWTRDFVRALHHLDCVDTVDLKGMYEGTIVDLAPDAERYAMIAEELPKAWIEDPKLNDETRSVLAPHMARVTWDAPIHSIADVDALEHAPRCLNSKPSRFGKLETLFAFYDACAERGIELYAGGQFELSVGRDQIQELATLFHPKTANDCAPSAYNVRPLAPALPRSPMRAPTGFGAAQ